jgi:hypothetical protein
MLHTQTQTILQEQTEATEAGIGRSLLTRSTRSSVRQAQDDPERSRMGQGPERGRGTGDSVSAPSAFSLGVLW